MTQLLGKVIADFETQLATKISVGGTTATLASATDDDGVALPSGRYFFTIDKGNSKKEHISCSLSGTALTNIKTVTRQGTETAGVAREHRVGANVIISDFAHLKKINDVLDGTTSFDSATPLGYDGAPSITTGNQLATKTYVDTQNQLDVHLTGDQTITTGVKTFVVSPIVPTPTTAFQAATKAYADALAIAGAPDASTTVKGISEEATQAEILAGTAAGGTSARLFVNPSTLITALPLMLGADATTEIPRSVIPSTEVSDTTRNVNTRMYFGLVNIAQTITVNKLSFNVSVYNAVAGTMKVALFSQDGGTKLFEITTASISATGLVTTTLSSPVTILKGKYYIAHLSQGGSYSMPYYVYSSNAYNFYNLVSGKNYYTGYKTVTADTIPTTFDPTASVTADSTGCLIARLDN